MAVAFTITKPSDASYNVTGNIGDASLTDTDAANISQQEAQLALAVVRARSGADAIPEGEYANYSIQIGTATVTLARLKEIAEPAAPPPPPTPPPTSSTRQGLQLRLDGRAGYGSDFGHSGFTWEVAPGVTHTFPSDWYFGGEVGVFGRPSATGPSPSEMSLFGVAPRVVGGRRIQLLDNGELQLRLEGSLGYRLFSINSPEDQPIPPEQQGRIDDASSGGRGFAGTNPEPQDTRLGTSGICAGGLCLQREGFGHGPEVGITPAIEWTPTDGSWGLRAGGRGTLGYSSAEVDGHNPGDPGLPLSGVNWSVMALIGGFFGGTPRAVTPQPEPPAPAPEPEPEPTPEPEPVEVTTERTVTVAGTNVVMTPGRTYPRQGSGDATIVLLQASQAKAVFIKLDNEREERVELQANTPYEYRVTDAILGGMVVDSAHNVTVRIDGDTQSFSFPFTVIAARPPVAALSAASVTSTATLYMNDSITIRVTSDRETDATIYVGNHVQEVDLVVGVNNITMTGQPKTWDTGATAGQHRAFMVQIRPTGGSAMDIGQVTIKRAGGGGTTTRVRTPPPL